MYLPVTAAPDFLVAALTDSEAEQQSKDLAFLL